ncbi:MAG: peptidylprolyl isomerase [Kiloniellales bacterium]|nr:peptidylprolyl isomerase [Kiloniellales bacterium]
MKRIWRFLAVATTAFLLFNPTMAGAQQSLRAAAIVNDEVISLLDLEMRIRLAMLAAGVQPSPEAQRSLGPQVLRNLIDERLQLQEAERLGIEVSRTEIEAAIDTLAEQNKRSRAEFINLLTRRGVMLEALIEQLKATIAWQGVIARQLSPQVTISEEEIEAAVARQRAGQGKTVRLVAEIFLAVDDPAQDEEIRGSAQRLIDQLQKGARFQDLARQFSQSATAPVGGDLGWVGESQLPAELNDALSRMSPGQIGGPIRSLTGYHVILFRKQRRIEAGDEWLGLKQAFLPVARDADAEAAASVRSEAVELAGTLNGCASMDEAAEDLGGASGDLGEVKVADLPINLRNAVASLEIGQASRPIQRDDGFVVLMVCSRRGDGIDRDRIESGLRRERVDMLSRRHLRDLRRAANVEMRI